MSAPQKGRLIVLEGTDGSGKSTQFAKLCQRVQAEGIAFRRLVFPQYQEESSALLRMYLRGEFGKRPEDVNAYAASSCRGGLRHEGLAEPSPRHWADRFRPKQDQSSRGFPHGSDPWGPARHGKAFAGLLKRYFGK